MTSEIVLIEGLTFVLNKYNETEIQDINEAKYSGRPLIGTYTYDIHQPHNPTGEYHIHLSDKGNEILSMNKGSGTAHDGYHGVRIPNKAFKALKKRLSDWNWPEDQIIESITHTFFIDRKSPKYLRPVKISKHQNHDLQDVEAFVGFFHQFAEDPFLTGGNGGWKERTVALVETEDGYIKKVPLTCFKFADISIDRD